MTEISDHYRKVAAPFTERVEQVPDDAWDNPSPVDGWVTRDVVRHLVDWVGDYFYERWDIEPAAGPTVDEDPVRAWLAFSATIQAALDDPAIATKVVADTPMGPGTFQDQVDMIVTPDIFMHTWDLARAAGLDETLDPDEVHRMFVGMEPMDQMLRESGQYGPRVPVPDDADEQTKLIAFIGRQP